MSLPGVRNLEPLARRAAPVIPPATTVGELWDRPPLGTHDRTVARLPIARTRQVTVSKIICGVDVSSRSLQARIGPDGVSHCFANTSEGIAELAQFCRQHGVELVAMEATGGYEKQSFAQLWAQGLAGGIFKPPPGGSLRATKGHLAKDPWFCGRRKCLVCLMRGGGV